MRKLEKISGVHAVLETLVADERKIEKIYLAQGTQKGRLKEIEDRALFGNIQVDFVGPSLLNRLCGHSNHQGVLAMARPFPFVDLNHILGLSVQNNQKPFLLVIDQVQDPRNLGAIMRSAEGAGVHGVIMTQKRTSRMSDVVVKASAGACEHLKICRVVNLVSTLEYLKTLGIWIVGAAGEGDNTIYDIDGMDATALVVGNEEKGLRHLVKKTCDWLVRIPMRGKVSSLNVSTATSIMLFEIQRQRDRQRP